MVCALAMTDGVRRTVRKRSPRRACLLASMAGSACSQRRARSACAPPAMRVCSVRDAPARSSVQGRVSAPSMEHVSVKTAMLVRAASSSMKRKLAPSTAQRSATASTASACAPSGALAPRASSTRARWAADLTATVESGARASVRLAGAVRTVPRGLAPRRAVGMAIVMVPPSRASASQGGGATRVLRGCARALLCAQATASVSTPPASVPKDTRERRVRWRRVLGAARGVACALRGAVSAGEVMRGPTAPSLSKESSSVQRVAAGSA